MYIQGFPKNNGTPGNIGQLSLRAIQDYQEGDRGLEFLRESMQFTSR